MVAARELTYDTNASALQMANQIFGNGTVVTGATYTGAGGSSAIYSNATTLAPGVTPGHDGSGVILSTGNATSFTNSWGRANQSNSTSTNTSGPDNYGPFNDAVGAGTHDASMLTVDFIPTGDVMTMNFVFASDEYPEYSNTIYNDSVVVWINGTAVPLSVGDGDTAVGNVNQSENVNLYHDNTSSQFNTEMDGFTVTLKLTIPVNAGVVNTIRIGIADVSDSAYDSNLLIATDSVQTQLVALDDEVTMKEGATKTLDLLGNDVNHTPFGLRITQINGIDVHAGSEVTLQTGQVVHVNADGTVTITTDADHDDAAFTYEVSSVSPVGTVVQTDVGLVTVHTIPCFVAGTRIRTPDGEVAVETLAPGDLVLTQDDGPQPVRWIGRRTVAATGPMAPIRILGGTLGPHRTLLVSPQHRVLIRDSLAELLFGEGEVLVAAKDLVNDRTIRPVEGGDVTYVHFLFDRHQVVFSEGLPTESFLPGPQTTRLFEKDIVEEILTIFPELDPMTGAGYSPSARRTLKPFEARVLLGAAA